MKQSLFEWCKENARLELIEQWDYEKNGSLLPEHVSACAGKNVWWKCEKGHSWEALVSNRNKGQGCPYCSGHRILKGFNDFESQYPELAEEWDYEKNEVLQPSEVTPKSDKRVWWKCEKQHSWQAPVKRRTLGSGCPVCANKVVLRGYNDVASQYPDLVLEWDYEKNQNVNPTEITFGHDKKVWWKCEKGHSWQSIIGDRIHGNGCLYCSKRKQVKAVVIKGRTVPEREISGSRILSGYNDLDTLYPELMEEWDYSKNDNVDPTKVGRGSECKVWWKCERGHSWQAIISNRVKGVGCPMCSKGQRISFAEKAILYYVRKVFENVEENYRTQWLGKSELDIYIPELNIAIEYDGAEWHKKEEKDRRKDELCFEHGITLIRIREEGAPLYKSLALKYYVTDDSVEEIEKAIAYVYEICREREKELLFPVVDLQKEKEHIYAMVYQSRIDNSLAENFPELLAEWDYEKNGDLKPSAVFSKSKIKVWWKCSLGHSWQAVVHTRSNGCGCPVCSGKKVLVGYNDLATIRPDIAVEWNEARNEISPCEVTASSNKKVWWKCICGQEWEAKINSRTSLGTGCPVCGRKKASTNKTIKGEERLLKNNPIFKEFDIERNEDIDIQSIRIGSGRNVWWICSVCGMSWNAQIHTRVQGFAKCPRCSGKSSY